MKGKRLITVLLCAAVLIAVVCVTMNKSEQLAVPNEVSTSEATATPEAIETPGSTPEPTEDSGVIIEMAYGTSARIPKEFSDMLVHEQEVHETLTTEVFSMKIGETNTSLYRIDFGDEQAGDWLGRLVTESGDVPVTCTVFVVPEEELSALGEGASEIYADLMKAFNVMIEGILNDPRFTVEKPLAVGEDTEVKTTYWTLTLPSNMTVVESIENDTYVAMFYGEVAGERTALYTVRIGDDKAETELGLFEIDGVKKPISVGSFDLSEKPNWSDGDYSAAYRMMDTINHVIDTIMNSAQFSIPD